MAAVGILVLENSLRTLVDGHLLQHLTRRTGCCCRDTDSLLVATRYSLWCMIVVEEVAFAKTKINDPVNYVES